MKQFRLILILWLCMAMNAKANETAANLLQQGDSCLSRYDVFHATQYYQKYLEANPSHLGARRKLASCYRKVGNYTACISCLDSESMQKDFSIKAKWKRQVALSFLN
jgi:Tfp pilus assembly protein PilF